MRFFYLLHTIYRLLPSILMSISAASWIIIGLILRKPELYVLALMFLYLANLSFRKARADLKEARKLRAFGATVVSLNNRFRR